MGRIGNRILDIPKEVQISADRGHLVVKGPRGTLELDYKLAVKVEIEESRLRIVISSKDPKVKALQGLYNSLVNNMITGVTRGFEKDLEMVGVGYRAAKQGKNLQISIGFSHPVIIEPPPGIDIEVQGQNKIKIKGIDKQMVGEIAAEIRRVRSVEPYKGKGIRYAGERVRKKAGKAAKAASGA